MKTHRPTIRGILIALDCIASVLAVVFMVMLAAWCLAALCGCSSGGGSSPRPGDGVTWSGGPQREANEDALSRDLARFAYDPAIHLSTYTLSSAHEPATARNADGYVMPWPGTPYGVHAVNQMVGLYKHHTTYATETGADAERPPSWLIEHEQMHSVIESLRPQRRGGTYSHPDEILCPDGVWRNVQSTLNVRWPAEAVRWATYQVKRIGDGLPTVKGGLWEIHHGTLYRDGKPYAATLTQDGWE